MLIENVKAGRDFLFAYRADRLYERIGFAENIDLLEKNSRSIAQLFFIIYLTAFTHWIYLADCFSVKSLISVSCYHLFFFICHDLNIMSFSAFCNSYHLYRLFCFFINKEMLVLRLSQRVGIWKIYDKPAPMECGCNGKSFVRK